MTARFFRLFFLCLFVGVLVGVPTAWASEPGGGSETELGTLLPLWSVIPFVGILLSIAILPLTTPQFWSRHFAKVAAAWAAVFAIPFLLAHGERAWDAILHIYLLDYVPFLILLFGLFTVAGGIVVRGNLRGTPETNAVMLLIGTLLASWIGTTGAAMVMIRPVLRANADRKNKIPVVVFFIFLVANIGGSLTPLGDPPLFLGFLHGVDFFWTLHMFKPMVLAGGLLLAAFYVLDRIQYRREGKLPEAPAEERQKFGLGGAHNFLFLLGIVGAVLLSGFWQAGSVVVAGLHLDIQSLARDGLILLMAALSLITTRNQLRHENEFSWHPIKEVAYLFFGIFMTIIPALAILKSGEHGALGPLIHAATSPAHYFWASGLLSSFLDNAPTYLTFFNSELGKFYPGMPEAEAVKLLMTERMDFLLAVSAGSVFMGCNTYIGNAPNFMVKSIAEEAGIPMPSFFGYILRWSLLFAIPAFIIVTLVFF